MIKVAQYVRNIGYVQKGKDGKDGENAILYKIDLSEQFLHLKGDGEWAEGITTNEVDGVTCAAVLATFSVWDGNHQSVLKNFCSLNYGDRWAFGVHYNAFVYVRPTDTHLHLTLYDFENNPPHYNGYVIAESDIYVIKDGEDGQDGDNGDRGYQGARCRQHDGFVDGEYEYQCGEDGEDFWDVVLVGGKVWYRCIESHSSSGKDDECDNPSSDVFPQYWSNKGMTNVDFIATKFFLAENGQINLLGAQKIRVGSEDGGSEIVLSNGVMEFFGSVNKSVPNIRIGINSEGYQVLSYYDNEGTLLYDLGPKGLDVKNVKPSSLEELTVVEASVVGGKSVWYRMSMNSIYEPTVYTCADNDVQKNLFGIDVTSSLPSSQGGVGFKPASAKYPKVKLYRYVASRFNGTVIKDEKLGLATAALAEQADGKLFTSNTVLGEDGSLTNLASGWYIENDATVGEASFETSGGATYYMQLPTIYANKGVDTERLVHGLRYDF